MKSLLFLCQFLLLLWPAQAQTLEDGILVPAKTIFGGYLFTHDSWDQYWEGSTKRTNGNIGTLTTQTSTVYLSYGVLDRLNVLANIPYVWTQSSQGVLGGHSDWQDITVAVKYRAVHARIRHAGTVSVFAVPFWGAPLTGYSPDLQPLSIGLASRRAGIRSTINAQSRAGWFVNASGAYTWRGDVHLDRPYYFTNGQFFPTNVVEMPRLVDYVMSPGFRKKSHMFQFNFGKVLTQGGAASGDIRRQDLPFVSNRVISTRIGGMAMVPLPWFPTLAFRLEYSYVIDARNSGQSTTITTGLLKTQSLGRRKK